MDVFITDIVPWYPTKVALQWVLEDSTEVGVYLFDVERSGSPSGPWTVIASALPDTYVYEDPLDDDEDPDIISLSRDIYYRVKVTPPSGPTGAVYSLVINIDGAVDTTRSGPADVMGYSAQDPGQYEYDPSTGLYKRPIISAEKRLLRRRILHEEYTLLKKLAGVEYVLLKRRHFGTRCSECYDPASSTTFKAQCTACYGTAWEGGYFNPITILGRRRAAQTQHSLGPQTEDEVHRTNIQLLDFPRVEEGDILVEKESNRRFQVRQRYKTSLKTITVHQTLSVSELARKAIEYKIPIT